MKKNNSKACSNNTEELRINQFTRMEYDDCEMKNRYNETTNPGKYSLFNFHSCKCKASDIEKVANNQPNVYFKDGYGWTGLNGCIVDNDSNLRFKDCNKLTKFGEKNQLFHRPYLSVPFMGRGIGNACLETQLKPGEDTSQKKQCNSLSGNYKDNNFIPLIPSIKNNIQKPEHIIHDSALNGWIRGGLPSRQIVRNINYIGDGGKLYTK